MSEPTATYVPRSGEIRSVGAGRRGMDRPSAAPPTMLTTFVGRRRELDTVAALLGDNRILSITGAGGCGKTRLAVETLARVQAEYRDGVIWADISQVTDPSRALGLVATAAGAMVEPTSDLIFATVRSLQSREAILCLDNCEHLIDVCAAVAELLAREAPAVTVLATSREPLGVDGETVWRVPSMDVPDAVDLFAERARAHSPAYELDERRRSAVETIVRRLDTIPLAVELAAAWMSMLTEVEIVDALDDRFGFLVGSHRGTVPRHRTLRASLDWSFDLLDEAARRLLRRTGVFSSDFTLDGAHAVCDGDDLPSDQINTGIRRLVDASLVTVRQSGGRTRFRLVETVAAYAIERLDDANETGEYRDRHAAHFVEFANAALAEFDHGDQDAALAAFEREHDNLLAALEWSIEEGERGATHRLAVALARFWLHRGGAHVGIDVIHRALDQVPDETPTARADLLCALAMLAMPSGRLDLLDGSDTAVEIGRRLGDDRLIGRALAASTYRLFYTDFEQAERTAHEAEEHGRAADDPFAVDFAQLMEACSLTNRDRHDDAVAVADDLLARCRPRHDRICGSFGLAVKVWAALFGGDLGEAARLGREAVEFAGPLADYFVNGTNITNLVWVTGLSGDLDTAHEMLEPVIRTVRTEGPDVDVANVSVVAGKLALWSGELGVARRWFETAAHTVDAGPNWLAVRALPGLAAVARLQGDLDEAAGHARAARDMARTLMSPHVIAEALDELARATGGDSPVEALDLHHEALRIRVDHSLWTFVPDSLDAIAHATARMANHVDAARIIAASDAARSKIGYPRPAVDEASHTEIVEGVCEELGGDTDQLEREGAALTIDEAVRLVSRTRGPRCRPPTGWASLTPTELDVVDVIVEGLTNAAAAERLFVSPSTIKTHLKHVYVKLDVSNRAQLAAVHARSTASTATRHDT